MNPLKQTIETLGQDGHADLAEQLVVFRLTQITELPPWPGWPTSR